MEQRLKDSLKKWWDQIEKLAKIEEVYRELEATEKYILGVLIAKDLSKSGPVEKRAKALASEDFINLSKGLASATVQYHTEERRLDLYKKSYDAEYLSSKQEFEAINKRNPKIGD